MSTAQTGATKASTASSSASITDLAVLEYLKSKGMGNAVLQLTQKIKEDQQPASTSKSASSSRITREQLESEDETARAQRTVLIKSTGGGYGYDRDAAAPIAQWGVPDNIATNNKGSIDGQRRVAGTMGEREAKSYLDAFVALQLWILSLPDDSGDDDDANNKPDSNILSTVLSELAKPSAIELKKNDYTSRSAVYPIPPSAKAELLSVSFALLVHTYCELLEVGMESTAHVLRDAFQPIYDPLPSGYGTQYKDLYHCVTTEDMVKLNTHNSQHMEALANLKTILVQVASIQMKQKELANAIAAPVNVEPATKLARQKKLQEYEQTVGLLQQKHTELSQRASHAFERMYDLPFLRRARAVRWQLTLSTTSYGMLCQFLNANIAGGNNDTSLLAMSTLLQTKCELHVEQRDPLPFTPAVILEDNSTSVMNSVSLSSSSSSTSSANKASQNKPVQWAAPVAGLSGKSSHRPFPNFHLEEEYEDEQSARRDKRSVEFNRSLLINGFRRLEALERKRDFQAMTKVPSPKIDPSSNIKDKQEDLTDNTRVRRILADPLEPSVMLSTLCANQTRRRDDTDRSSNDTSSNVNTPNFLWEEAGIGITCAKLCPPDGRRVAVGCDDSAIRIWNLMDDLNHKKNGSSNSGGNQTPAGDAGQVLLGHKNGFPIFDLSWNRDGRCLLSAGGDGSIRLWDTAAQGPFGEVIQSSSINGATGPATSTLSSSQNIKKPIITNAIAKEALTTATENLEMIKRHPEMTVPGLRPESRPYTSGAALAVYRGHAPNTPIWSVAFSPSGYYFASGGSDATARLWTTDRSIPVRLFTGHTSNCIHSVVFHPNCNYVLTGSDDKTARLWDIQTGQCVRLLNGCPAGIYKVDIDPSGQYAVGADVLGTVHVWDLGTATGSFGGQRRQSVDMIHSFAFSPCGRALATGGDDRCVRIWDIRKAITDPTPIVANPVKSFATRRTMIMDLQYTKRNLLLSVGKYISAIPTVNRIVD
ncbi:WD40 repeat-like protein [Fragilariopsis cylindrus CCMP1102]|uniref:WD40 repeat-like protein n=1 Tax=Fragilariopsis cylindrus CCMP1102 TaxID=635003 RepID=A0A1E7FR30_9STRA|nr:WD40 repeat-like protein [Fragilariopsis cylindrus CCMP1102]|eukprot:OEU20606.1 WD40 repeat-like protein [Fragilariopsis cylindrus CCMP1102]